jgi:hypothetical protein
MKIIDTPARPLHSPDSGAGLHGAEGEMLYGTIRYKLYQILTPSGGIVPLIWEPVIGAYGRAYKVAGKWYYSQPQFNVRWWTLKYVTGAWQVESCVANMTNIHCYLAEMASNNPSNPVGTYTKVSSWGDAANWGECQVLFDDPT